MTMREERGMPMMWIKHILMMLLSFSCGAAISAGTFAFLLVIGVVPRILGKTKESKRIFGAENCIVSGVLTGAVLSVFLWSKAFLPEQIGHLILTIYGLSAGIFVGCIAVALAEILNTFPIVFRRLKIKKGLSYVMVCMALGKMAGAFYYFLNGYGQ